VVAFNDFLATISYALGAEAAVSFTMDAHAVREFLVKAPWRGGSSSAYGAE